MPAINSLPTWDETTSESPIPSWDDTKPLSAPRQEEIKAAPTFTEEIGKALTSGPPMTQGLGVYNVLKHRLFPEEPAPYGVKPLEEPSLLGTTEEIPIDQTDTSPLGIAKGVSSATVNIGNKLMHGATTLKGIASLPLFMLPGVAEGYAVDTLAKTPQQYEAIKRTLETQGGAAAAKEATETGLGDAMAVLPFVGREKIEASTRDGVSKGLQPETAPKFEETSPLSTSPQAEVGMVSPKPLENHALAAELGLPPEIEKPLRDNFPPVEETSPPVEATQTTGAPAGTSNRMFEETYGEGAIPGGEGVDTGMLLDNARADVRSGKVDPYEVLSRTRQDGIASPKDYATLAAEHERLVNEAVAKERAGDPEAAESSQRASDFANAIQPHKTAASDLMRLFQGDLNYDLSTAFGMNEYMKAELGRGMKPNETAKFEQRAQRIRQAEKDVQGAIRRSDARVQTRYAKVRDIPIEEAASRVKEMLKDCQV